MNFEQDQINGDDLNVSRLRSFLKKKQKNKDEERLLILTLGNTTVDYNHVCSTPAFPDKS